jgi:hypothetical protein
MRKNLLFFSALFCFISFASLAQITTLYHFPGGVAATPTFSRIGSKKAEAPSNLPS